VEVQVVKLTAEIKELQGHCEHNPKDFSSKRGLLQKVNQRKRFLDYLKHHNQNAHKELVKELGLRK
jgi:small subunit ribosomal protein S15